MKEDQKGRTIERASHLVNTNGGDGRKSTNGYMFEGCWEWPLRKAGSEGVILGLKASVQKNLIQENVSALEAKGAFLKVPHHYSSGLFEGLRTSPSPLPDTGLLGDLASPPWVPLWGETSGTSLKERIPTCNLGGVSPYHLSPRRPLD